MEESKNIILIERYLREELSEADKQSFEQQLEKDINLANTFAIEKEIFEAVQIAAEERFRGRLTNIQATNTNETKALPLYQRRWFLAASLLFLLSVTWFLWPNQQNLSPDELFAANYTPPNFNTTRTNASTDERLVLAAAAYRQKQYATTIQHLEGYQQTNFDAKIGLVIGACYLELQQFSNAVTAFETVRQQSDLDDDATWYLGLTHLKAKELPLAKNEFEKLLSGEFLVTPKRQNLAKELLQAIIKVK